MTCKARFSDETVLVYTMHSARTHCLESCFVAEFKVSLLKSDPKNFEILKLKELVKTCHLKEGQFLIAAKA